MATITTLSQQRDLDSVFARAGSDRLVLIDFTASWCGPCKMIAPKFQQWSTEFRQVIFAKCDVDQARPIAQSYRVSAMPTFVFIRNRETLETIKGANPPAIEAAIRRHAGPPQPGYVEGTSASSSSSTTDKALGSHTSLLTQIDMSQTTCLNEAPEHGIRDLLKSSGSAYLESDADEQLLLGIAFLQSVKLFAIRLTTHADHLSHAPKTVRIFSDALTIGFDEASSQPPAQEFVLSRDQAAGKELIMLRYVKFQKINSIAIFISDNQDGEDVSRLDKLEIFGSLETATAAMTNLRGEAEE